MWTNVEQRTEMLTFLIRFWPEKPKFWHFPPNKWQFSTWNTKIQTNIDLITKILTLFIIFWPEKPKCGLMLILIPKLWPYLSDFDLKIQNFDKFWHFPSNKWQFSTWKTKCGQMLTLTPKFWPSLSDFDLKTQTFDKFE